MRRTLQSAVFHQIIINIPETLWRLWYNSCFFFLFIFCPFSSVSSWTDRTKLSSCSFGSWVILTLARVTSISRRASRLLWKYELMGNSLPWGGFPRNMEPGRAKGTENSCSHNFRVVSSAELSLEPSDRSFTESSCFRTKPRMACRSAWYSWGWTWKYLEEIEMKIFWQKLPYQTWCACQMRSIS